MPDTPANNDVVTKILDRFDQVEKKITGEIQAVRKEAQDFHSASKETWGHFRNVLENSDQKRASFEQKMDRRWDEQHRIWSEIWDGIRRSFEKSDQRTLNYENTLARVNEDIEVLKRNNAMQETIIRELQQRLSKLEAAQNLSI